MTGAARDTEVLSDDALVILAQNGDKNATDMIFYKYRGLVSAKAGGYYLAGGEEDDLKQEGFIGLLKAIRDYVPGRETSFYTFASLCVSRNMLSAVRAYARKKHNPLNSYISLNKSLEGKAEGNICSRAFIRTELQDPETIVINRENLDGIACKINSVLSRFECSVLEYYLEGRSYKEIAGLVKRDAKAVDNAVQRTRKKLELLFCR